MKLIKRTSSYLTSRALRVMKFVGLDLRKYYALHAWRKASFASPSPHFIKQACVIRNGLKDCTYIETGTYLGDTTALLGLVAEKVISIEPEINLYKLAQLRFKKSKNIKIMNGTSEQIFPVLIPELRGDVSFWLDGHYSAGGTFQGINDTPIVEELREISRNLTNLRKVVIMVDDIRCFDPATKGFEGYPTRSYLVNWADKNKLAWTIEHDIFIARN